MNVIGLSGTQYNIDSKLLSDGGEGKIYRILGDQKVAKIYKPGIPTHKLEEKLKYMVSNQPSKNILNQVAWPLDVIYENNQFIGFIMPELKINAELGDIYKYPSKISISSLQKIIIAENICAVISEVHKAGYVFGDFNPRNIGIDKSNCTVAFLDTDSYHIVNSAQNKIYRCNVCAPGYVAPELLEKCADHIRLNPSSEDKAYAKTPLPTFTKETDNFALAIHIFKLLMNGYSPYGGIPDKASPSQASPGTGDAAVRRDNYCFKKGFNHQSVAIPTINSFPNDICDLFTKAFINGKSNPTQRPSPIKWHNVLNLYEKTLVTCKKNPLHQYGKNNKSCPLCEADRRYIDIMEPAITQKPGPAIISLPTNYTLTFNTKGGNNLANQQKSSGQNLGVLPTPHRSGYDFAGWFTSASGGSQIFGYNSMPASNYTIYAHWNKTYSPSILKKRNSFLFKKILTIIIYGIIGGLLGLLFALFADFKAFNIIIGIIAFFACYNKVDESLDFGCGGIIIGIIIPIIIPIIIGIIIGIIAATLIISLFVFFANNIVIPIAICAVIGIIIAALNEPLHINSILLSIIASILIIITISIIIYTNGNPKEFASNVLSSSKEFVFSKLSGKNKTEIQNESNTFVYVNVSNNNVLNLRAEPKDNSTPLKKLKNYTVLSVIGNSKTRGTNKCSKGWINVEYEKQKGWVCSNHVK